MIVYQLLCSDVPSVGTSQRDGSTPSRKASQELDVLYLNCQNMSTHLEMLLLQIPHPEYIL